MSPGPSKPPSRSTSKASRSTLGVPPKTESKTSRETAKTTSKGSTAKDSGKSSDHTASKSSTRTSLSSGKAPAPTEWEIEEERRKQELVEFLEDLGNSEEFQEFLSEKQRRRETHKDVELQTEEMVEVEEEESEPEEAVEEEKFPLTLKSGREREKRRRYENLLFYKINRRKKKFQEESVRKIRQIIAEDKRRLFCHAEERKKEKKEKVDEALEELETSLGISIMNLHLIKDKIVGSFLCHRKIRRFQKEQQRGREIAIIAKLLKEYERQKQIDGTLNKTYDYKVKRKERVIEDMEIVGVGLRPPSAETVQEEEEAVKEEEKVEKVEIVVEKPVKKGKEGKEKRKGKKEKGAKKEKKPKEKKEKKGKKSEDLQFTMPQVPIVNEHVKLAPDEMLKLTDLVAELPELERLEHEKGLYQDALTKKDLLEAQEDTLTVTTPKQLTFKAFKNGSIYRKRLAILNSSNCTKKYRLYKVEMPDILDTQLLEVERVGIKQIAAGISFTLTITFSPVKLEGSLEGRIIFLAYYAETGEQFQFSVPVTCIPLYSEIVIAPSELSFERTPIWVVQNRPKMSRYKSFTFKNLGTRASIVTIKKVRDPLQIEEKWKEISGETVEDENVKECVESVFDYFEFEHYVMELAPESERLLRVYFKNADHVGYYFEKYTVDVYERIDEKTDKCLGCQELSLTAETTGNYITVTPETLDFGLCVLNSVYQLPFAIKNSDKLPHSIALKFPKRLTNSIRANPSSVIIQPKAKALIYLKLIPRFDMARESTYFDEVTNLLAFPVYIYVSERSAGDVPRIKLLVFAGLYQPLPLTLRPLRKSGTSLMDCCHFMLQMGECTTRETIYGKIAITNESHMVHHFGFLNLPESITIVPNYGFGTVEPLQTLILLVMFSPRFEDIPEKELKATKLCYPTNFQISVNTVKNMGGIKEFTDYKSVIKLLLNAERELQNTIDPPLMRDIYLLHYLLIKNQYEYMDSMRQPLEEEEPKPSPLQDITPPPNTKETSSRDVEILFSKKSPLTSRATIKSSEKKSSKSEEILIVFNEEPHRDFYSYFGLPSEVPLTEGIEEEKEKSAQNTVSSFKNFPSEWENHKLQIEAVIVNPLCELSQQFLAFPTTPCGSYSIMTIELRALSNAFDLHCDCGHFKKKHPEIFTPVDYEAEFEIVGTGKQFTIEPTYGTLRSGEVRKLTVIARPETPADIVEDQAKAIKIEEVRRELFRKLMEEKEAAKGNKGKGKGKGKDKGKGKGKGKEKERKKKEGKGKKGKEAKEQVVEATNAEPRLSEIEVPENLVELTYLDYYPAEMCVWRSLEPYSIESDFMCTVNYKHCELDRQQDKLFLKATCKVIRPDFITNLRTQHLDFGLAVIGTTAKRVVEIQNILYEEITPSVTLLSPTGPFSCPNLKNSALPPESTLNLPITFVPEHEDLVTEYMEIKSRKTIYCLKLTGRGTLPNIFMRPEFLVYRLEAPAGGHVYLPLEVANESDGNVIFRFLKTHDVEGPMVKVEKPPKPKVKEEKKKGEEKTKGKGKDKKDKGKGSKKDTVSTKSSKSSKKEKGKKLAHSMELTEDEVFSLQTHFTAGNGEASFFHMEGPVTLEPSSKASVNLRFGVPATPEEMEQEKNEKPGKKGKKGKGDKTPPKPATPGPDQPSDQPKKYYVAKYNIFFGTTLWRDFMVIASFK